MWYDVKTCRIIHVFVSNLARLFIWQLKYTQMALLATQSHSIVCIIGYFEMSLVWENGN